MRGDWRGWSPLKEVEVLQYEDMGEAGYASCAEYFFSFDLIFLLLGEVIILGGEVFQAIFSKGFPPSRLYRPWGPTHTSYFFILGEGFVMEKNSKRFPPSRP